MNNTIYYLRCIQRRVQLIQEALPEESGLSLGSEALADEANWLDCYIDHLERAELGPVTTVGAA